MSKLTKFIVAGAILSTAVGASASELVRYNGGRSGMHSYRVQTEQPKTVAVYTDGKVNVQYVPVEQKFGAYPSIRGRAGYTGRNQSLMR